MDKREVIKEDAKARTPGLVRCAGDVLTVWGVILVSVVVIIFLAIATPVILVISAIAGLVDKRADRARSTWRPARA